jgi:hypothetical protein
MRPHPFEKGFACADTFSGDVRRDGSSRAERRPGQDQSFNPRLCAQSGLDEPHSYRWEALMEDMSIGCDEITEAFIEMVEVCRTPNPTRNAGRT